MSWTIGRLLQSSAHVLVGFLPWIAVAGAEAKPILTLVADVPLPVQASRFDYLDVDPSRKHVVIAHMGADEILVAGLDGKLVGRVPDVRTVRGVRVAGDANLILATAAATDELVRIDATTLKELGRTRTGRGPDGLDWDPVHRIVAVSDQKDGAVSLISDLGNGPRRQVRVGEETGNVVFDGGRKWFWVAVVRKEPPDALVALDPETGAVRATVPLPGCKGAHGLRLHPDGRSAFVACEDDDVVARVDLAPPHAMTTAPAGAGPDVLAIDPGLGRLYVAAERGDLHVFDVTRPGLVRLGHQDVGRNAHSLAVDPASHRVYVPLVAGRDGSPSLRVMEPYPKGRPATPTSPPASP